MRFVLMVFMLFVSAVSLTADTTKVIVVGSFSTPENAQHRVDSLKWYLRYEPESYALQKAGDFAYEVRIAPPYYVAVLHSFRNFDELLTVRNSIKKIFPDAFVKNNMNFTLPLSAGMPHTASEAAPAATAPAAVKTSPQQSVQATAPKVQPAAVHASAGTDVVTTEMPKAITTIVPETSGPSLNTFLWLVIVEMLGVAGFLLMSGRNRQPAF